MALSRITTWVDGNILTAAALNAEFDNILNNPVSLVSPLTAAIDLNGFPPTDLVLETKAVVPASTETGQLYWFSPQRLVIVHNGIAVASLGPNAVSPSIRGLQGSLLSNIGSFQALEYTFFRPAEGNYRMAVATSFSVNTQTAGPIANGRDQAAVFASTEIHFYAITTGITSTTPAGVVSTKPPPLGPTLPTNYNSWAYLCSAKYTTATSVMALAGGAAYVTGSQVRYQAPLAIFTDSAATSESTAALTTVVPSVATQYSLLISGKTIGASTGGIIEGGKLVRAQSGIDLYELRQYGGSAASTTAETRVGNSALVSFPVLSTEGSTIPFYYRNSITAGTSGTMTVEVSGYTVPNGDN